MPRALVTGASSGIGLATARILRGAGWDVVGISRTGREATERADLATEEGCAAAVDLARRAGGIDALVLSAGIGSAAERPVGEQPNDVWREAMALNLDAPFYLIRAAWPELLASAAGRIVIVSSTSATYGEPANTAYSASKAGVLGLTRSVAQDGAPHGITCNAVLPGWVRSEMSDRSAAAEAERTGVTVADVWARREAAYAAGRVVEADEVAHVIAFLCAPESSGVSGEAIRVALGDAW